MQRINVGLIGMGTIGTGAARVLTENAEVLSRRLGVELVLKRVADKDTTTDRGITLPGGVLTDNADDIINDPDISIVIELVGGTGIAKDFVLRSIAAGKHVVTANKALISAHASEIFGAAAKAGVDVGFEASVGGGIPVIKALRDGLVANNVESIAGIINGTANYILSTMTGEGGRFEDVLKSAQELGYAEADPTYDVEGIDTAHKLAILIDLAYGTYVGPDEIYTEGISNITELDIQFAREFGYVIKLLAIARRSDGKVEARVHPTMVPASHPLAKVDGAFNAVHIVGDAVGPVMLYGLGAGMMPTASAVVADVADIARSISAGVARLVEPLGCGGGAPAPVELKPIAELDIPYYIRFSAVDRPGVLSVISGVLGRHNISISSVIQKDRKVGGAVPLVIVTHHATERELRAAVAEIEELDVIDGRAVYIRMEETLGAA